MKKLLAVLVMAMVLLTGVSAVAEGSNKITVVTWEEDSSAYFPPLVEAFKAATGMEVEVINIDAIQYNDKIGVSLAAQNPYDVIFFKDVNSFEPAVAKNQIMPMNSFIEAENFDMSKYSGLFDALSLNGNYYAAPYRKDFQMVFYNKDIFDAAGVAYPTDGMTWDEFREMCKKVSSGEGNDKIYGVHEVFSPELLLTACRLDGFRCIDPSTYDVILPYMNTLLAMQKDDETIPDYAEVKATNNRSQFVNGTCAMEIVGTWRANQLIPGGGSEVSFNWGACPMPSLEGGVKSVGTGNVTPVAIGAYAANPAGAWEFIKFVCGEEGAKILAQYATIPGYNSESALETISAVKGIPADFSSYLAPDQMNLLTEMVPHMGESLNMVSQAYDLIMTYSATPEEAVQELTENVNALLAE